MDSFFMAMASFEAAKIGIKKSRRAKGTSGFFYCLVLGIISCGKERNIRLPERDRVRQEHFRAPFAGLFGPS